MEMDFNIFCSSNLEWLTQSPEKKVITAVLININIQLSNKSYHLDYVGYQATTHLGNGNVFLWTIAGFINVVV